MVGKCPYCNNTRAHMMLYDGVWLCGHCREKLRLVRKLIAIGRLIKEREADESKRLPRSDPETPDTN